MSSPEKISLCMIVRNEAEGIAKTLSAARSLVDEVLVVDTGSEDGTRAIAADYADRICDFAWCGDFAAARNFSLKEARWDWVLILDADEVVTAGDRASLQAFIGEKGSRRRVGRILRENPFEDQDGEKLHRERVNRFFNRREFCYEGIIHEQIVRRTGGSYETAPVDITAYHVGYTAEVLRRTGKIERNIALLQEAVAAAPKDPFYRYQLGKSYALKGEFGRARESFETALALKPDTALEYVQDLVESYGYSLLRTGAYADALSLESYRGRCAETADFQFLLGLIYMNNARFDDALNAFETAQGFTEGAIDGVTDVLPRYNMGVICEGLGRIEQALHLYRQCGDYTPARERQAVMAEKIRADLTTVQAVEKELEQGKGESAAALLAVYDPGEKLKALRGVLAMVQGDPSLAEHCFTAAAHDDPENCDVRYNLGVLCSQQGRIGEAKKWYGAVRDRTEDAALQREVTQILAFLDTKEEGERV
ncbi:MAG: tetratricopeptide repeat protein [Fibrobacterota bacterium]